MRCFPAGTLLLLFLINYIISSAQPCNLSGVLKIGPTGNYKSVTAATTALRQNGIGGSVILELQSTYKDTAESYPLYFHSIPCMDSSKSITIRPEAGAKDLKIGKDINGDIVNFSGARNVHFDGRPGGIDTLRQLTLTNNAGKVVWFSSAATYNSLRYVNIQGLGIAFSYGALPNSYNTIERCAIYHDTKGLITAIRSKGSPTGEKNQGNRIINNFIYGYEVTGVWLEGGNTEWEISGNHFFLIRKNYDYYSSYAIDINETSGSGFQIHNNYIGGTNPYCGGGTLDVKAFVAIEVETGTDKFSSIQGNIISRIYVVNPYSSSIHFTGIAMNAGKFKCGDSAGNIIGSQSTNNGITLINGGSIIGIKAATGEYTDGRDDTVYIKNNKIGGITNHHSNPNDWVNQYISGIFIEQKKGIVEISNNVVGSSNPPSNIISAVGMGDKSVVGINYTGNIYSTAQSSKCKINNNLVANITASVGISAYRGQLQILDNTVRDLRGSGISIINATVGSLVSGNKIYSLSGAGNGAQITGIGVSGEGVTVTKNFIHSFQLDVGFVSGSSLTGIGNGSFGGRVENNMIQLGIDTAGKNSSVNAIIVGIQTTLFNTTVINNSVFIGGSGTATSAAISTNGSITFPGRVLNNIFVNTRNTELVNSHNAEAFSHGIIYGGDWPVTAAAKLDNNIYYTSGTRSHLGYISLYDIYNERNLFTTLNDWKTITLQDSNSVFHDPNFINPLGDVSTVNLHLANPTPAEGQGVLDPNVVDDFDGQNRSQLSPVDIGADAGNFVFLDVDAPRITHKAFLGNPIPTTFVYKVKITDRGDGVDTSGNNKPRMWFRKKYPVVGGWVSLQGQMLEGNLNDGTWGFVPDYSSAGVTVSVGDSLEYYFVAQDRSPLKNIGYSNRPGTNHSSVSVRISAPLNPLRLIIYGIFPDTVYVGGGQQYTSLTNDGGFFQAAKARLFDTTKSKGLVVITSDSL